MENLSSHKDLRYLALAETALRAAAGAKIESVAEGGLDAAVKYIGLTAGALLIWDDKGKVTARAIVAPGAKDRQVLIDTEENLLRSLRQNFKLRKAYLELGGEPVRSVFSLPIELAGLQFGALIGIKTEATLLFDHDEFLKSLAAVLALAARPTGEKGGLDPEALEDKLKQERDRAIIELAVAVNHEINNPLTALIGNLQLLMMKNKDLPEEAAARLRTIEESANQIREVTARLMKAADAPSVVYTGNMKMIDLSDRSQKKKEDDREES